MKNKAVLEEIKYLFTPNEKDFLMSLLELADTPENFVVYIDTFHEDLTKFKSWLNEYTTSE
jgi:hypothetical protein